MKTGLLWKHSVTQTMSLLLVCLQTTKSVNKKVRFQWGNQEGASYDEFPWACIFMIVILFMSSKIIPK